MKKLTIGIVVAMLLIAIFPLGAAASETLIPGGQLIGLELRDGSVTVAGFEQSQAEKLQKAGLAVGDRIVQINGKHVKDVLDIRNALTSEKTVKVVIQREGKNHTLELTPTNTPQGLRLGVYLRRGISGVGTVSWYDPDTGKFGTLGHGVNDCNGNLSSLTTGNAYPARIITVKKGCSGQPGQLMGGIESQKPFGVLTANTTRGVFGTTETPFSGEPLPVASAEEIHTGKAVIRSTVDEKGVQEYSVEILKIYPKSKGNGRNLLLKVTDKALLETTGGIVQGMSGSPIIQDGKLVGAVTHVLVNDPTTGYGIFIENMLDAAA